MDNYKNFVERMTSFEDEIDITNTELRHFGIKGMKWGTRHIKQTKSIADSSHNMATDGQKINTSIRNIKTVQKRKDISKMSDDDLRKEVNRMNLESQYSNLSDRKITKGQTYLNESLNIAGGALGVASSALAIALAIKQLKG